MNNIHKHLEFKVTEEENKTINYLDLAIHRNNSNFQLGIYKKPAQTDRHYYTLYIQPSIRTQTRSVQLLHKQNAIYTNHRTSKTTRMEHHLYHS